MGKEDVDNSTKSEITMTKEDELVNKSLKLAKESLLANNAFILEQKGYSGISGKSNELANDSMIKEDVDISTKSKIDMIEERKRVKEALVDYVILSKKENVNHGAKSKTIDSKRVGIVKKSFRLVKGAFLFNNAFILRHEVYSDIDDIEKFREKLHTKGNAMHDRTK